MYLLRVYDNEVLFSPVIAKNLLSNTCILTWDELRVTWQYAKTIIGNLRA